MLNRVPHRPALVFGAVLLGMLGGCAGVDLSRANFERTTVKAEPGSGQGSVPTGPITDPAVSPSALRAVDPCKLLDSEVLGDFHSADDPYESEWGTCRVEARDAGGKAINFRLALGESLVLAEQATGNIEGLPLVENKHDGTCFVTAVTARRPDRGIGLQVDYEGGEACGPGYAVLSRVIQALRDDPPTYRQHKGSLIDADPCTGVDDAVLADVLGDEIGVQPSGLHGCNFGDGRATVYVWFRVGYPADPEEGTEIDLGGGITAIRTKGSTDLAACEVSWPHRPVAEAESEIVSVDYSDYGESVSKDQACTKATEFAKSVVKTLPSP